ELSLNDSRIDRLDPPFVIVVKFHHLDAALVSDSSGMDAVVVVEEPLALKLDDGVMSRPANYRVEDSSGVGEGPDGAVTYRIDEVMRVACGVREVVSTLVLVHPRTLKIASLGVPCGEG